MLADEIIEEILSHSARIDHVICIRIGTRTLVTLPQRIKESLGRTITRFHEPGRREIVLVTHFEHTTEITPDVMCAV